MRKIWSQKLLIPFIGVIFLCALVSPANAVTLQWIDEGTYMPSYGGTNPITYTLAFDELNDPSIDDAAFTISTTTGYGVPGAWRVGWIAFKFSPDGGDISVLSDSPVAWTIGADDTSLPWGNWGAAGNIKPFKNSWAGFYATDLTSEGLYGGLDLTGNTPVTYTFEFEFDIDDPGKLFTEEMPFKVGFYDGMAGPKVKTDQLSEDLVVPEPATMLLLGTGLIGMAAIGRRKFRKK